MREKITSSLFFLLPLTPSLSTRKERALMGLIPLLLIFLLLLVFSILNQVCSGSCYGIVGVGVGVSVGVGVGVGVGDFFPALFDFPHTYTLFPTK